MNELVFPLAGAAIVVLVVLPASAALAKLALVLLERHAAVGPLRAVALRYLLLTASSALPLAWFVSAGLHQAESGRSMLVCLLSHEATTLCLESGSFALALGAVVALRALGVARRAPRGRVSRAGTEHLRDRLQSVIARHPALRPLRAAIVCSASEELTLGTRGWLRPRVFIGAAFAETLTDDMLASALGHERAHVRALDPLRFALLELALAVNPLGRWLLEPHARRWFAAREVHCDREAVMQGFQPLPLADAIVRAARPGAREAVGLGAPELGVLELRIRLLLALAEREPTSRASQGLSALPLAAVLVLVALFLPHQTSTSALDALHRGVEHVLTHFTDSRGI
jgi:beta-lactamase regulating signal transducer with metallopeptidase domain